MTIRTRWGKLANWWKHQHSYTVTGVGWDWEYETAKVYWAVEECECGKGERCTIINMAQYRRYVEAGIPEV